MDYPAALGALVLIVGVELPDKTFVATLVLATRYRPLLVWVGVGAAFAVQTLIAVTVGGLLTRLPETPIAVAAAVLFAVGAVVLWRHARGADDTSEAERGFAGRGRAGATGLRVVVTSFAVLFLAEWGDLSQLLTAGLVARGGDPESVFVGALAGLLAVSGVGALLGRELVRRVRLSVVQRVGAGICAVLAVLTAAQAAGLDLPL
ncbi:MAG TPA: TMEM165/GDT1 family protein [Actinomycetales bacterium]|nr:TMEM165/GDT1 family protein [Actinomycetales bacterium]